jgi:hypothetical protein
MTVAKEMRIKEVIRLMQDTLKYERSYESNIHTVKSIIDSLITTHELINK